MKKKNKNKKKKWIDSFEEAQKESKKLSKNIPKEELWSLDMTICRYAAPRIKAYLRTAEEIKFTPGNLSNKKWVNILKKIDWAVTMGSCNDSFSLSEEDQKKLDKGMKLFYEYFHSLWW